MLALFLLILPPLSLSTPLSSVSHFLRTYFPAGTSPLLLTRSLKSSSEHRRKCICSVFTLSMCFVEIFETKIFPTPFFATQPWPDVEKLEKRLAGLIMTFEENLWHDKAILKRDGALGVQWPLGLALYRIVPWPHHRPCNAGLTPACETLTGRYIEDGRIVSQLSLLSKRHRHQNTDFFSCLFFEFIMESDRSVQEGLFFPLVDCGVNSSTVNSVDWCWKSLTLRFDSRSKKELKLTPCRKILILPNEGKGRQTNFTNASTRIQQSEIEVQL